MEYKRLLKEIAEKTAKKDVLEHELKALRDKLLAVMQEDGLAMDKDEGYAFILTKRPLDVFIDEPELVPDEYMQRVPNKALIRKHFSEGKELKFATIMDVGYTLQVRKQKEE